MTTVTFGRKLIDGKPAGTGITIPADGPTAQRLREVEGPIISNPVTGQWVGMLVAGEQTSGELARRLAIASPGNTGPPEHTHPSYEERFEVLAGEYEFHVGGAQRTLTEGETLTVPPATSHTYRNVSASVGSMIVESRPAGGVGDGIRTLFGLAHDGKVDEAGAPEFGQSVLMSAHRDDDTVFTKSARPIQHAVRSVVESAAALAGYPAPDPAYLADSFWTERVEQPTTLWTDTDDTAQEPGVVSGGRLHYGGAGTDNSDEAGIVRGSDLHDENSEVA